MDLRGSSDSERLITDEDLLRQFEDRTLPFAQWTHRAHIKIAYMYAIRYSFAEGLGRISAGIKAYNAANLVPEGPMSGYNQTTTHAFFQIVTAVTHAYSATHPVANADGFCDMHPQLMNKHVLRLFYSPERRMHPAAKTEFVEPDLAPLPKVTHSLDDGG